MSRMLREGPFVAAAVLFLASAGLIRSESAPTPAPANPSVGEKQLLLVLHDRPQLQPLVVPGSPVWAWLAAAFADKPDGVHVRWTNLPTSTFNLSPAESSSSPDDQNNLNIVVDDTYKDGPQQGQPRKGEEVLSTLVFELLNVQSYKEKKVLREKIRTRTIARNDFILAAAELEFRANLGTRKFYETILVPYAQQHSITLHPELWFEKLPTDFAACIALYPPTFWYPWKYFGDMYDATGAWSAAFSELSAGKYTAAIADFTKTINFGPEMSYWRGVAELATGDEDHSLADLNHAEAMPQADSSTRDESALLAWEIFVSKGLKAAAEQQLNDRFGVRLASPHKNDSAAKIALFLLDRMDEKAFLADAGDIQKVANYDQVSVAWYYVATKHAVAGDKTTARADFQKCVKAGDTRVAEYLIANAKLN